MKNIKLFERELDLIVNEDLRMAVKSYLEEYTPAYFWEIGASSSGRYHPAFSQDEGGLVRHTKAVVMFAEELLRLNTYAYMSEEYKDFVIAACLVHDTCKYGITDEVNTDYYKSHAELAAAFFEVWCVNNTDYRPSEFLLRAIAAHMGQWSTNQEARPFTGIDRCVHMADYMASRSFIDIPSITAEYNALSADTTNDDDLPF